MDTRILDPETQFSAWTKALQEKRLPAAIVDLNAFDHNIKKIADSVAETTKTIRIATKSIRVPELIKRVLDKGPPFKGVMCYSVEEAEYLYSLHIDDFLIAYPSVQKSDLSILRKMTDAGATVALVLDSKEQMQTIAHHLTEMDSDEKSHHAPLRIVLDIDMAYQLLWTKLGPLRTPVWSEQDIRDVLVAAKQYSSLKIVGAMAYEAVIAGLPDSNPFTWFLNPIKYWIRRIAVPDIATRRATIPEVFKSEGFAMDIFNGGGTGSLDSAVKETALSEVTVGSGLLCPHLYDYYSNLNKMPCFTFEPAAFFALQATRYPNQYTVTCAGGGYIASGETGADRSPIAVYPPGLSPVSAEGYGEVQTPLVAKDPAKRPILGQAVFFRHAKAGELAEHFNDYQLSDNGELKGVAKTYRGLGLSFLG